MYKRLRNYFKPAEVRTLPLKFDMDRDSDGKHVVRVYAGSGEKYKQIKKVDRLWTYGFMTDSSVPDHQITYTLCDDDRQVLYALKSLNPKIGDEGELVFEIEPPILKYLRRKENVAESPSSKQVTISEKLVRPTARIDFDPKTGLKIETGYQIEESDRLFRPDELKTSRDGKYVRLGNVFQPLESLSEKAKLLLSRVQDFVASNDIPEFVLRDMIFIKKEFNAVLTDLAKQIRVVTDPLEPVVRVEKDPQGWLDFMVSYNAAGFVLPLGLLSKNRGQEFIQIDPKTWIKVDKANVDKVFKELSEIEAEPTENGFRIPASEFVSLEEFIESIGGRAELGRSYREFLDQLTGFEADENLPLSSKSEELLQEYDRAPRPYQRAGIHWLDWLRRNHLHGILADDMGLGKTLQSLCALRLAYEQTKSQQHSLIIAPKSVLHHWEQELHRCYPQARLNIYHGLYRNRTAFSSNSPYVFITTYETVTRDIEEFSKIPFFYLILDEATRIKNPDTQRTKAIKALNAAHRLALSGTPVENRPAELWSQFDFLMRGHLGRFGTFVRIYEDHIMNGDYRASMQLGRRIRPFLLRRKKEEVAKDLPPKIILEEWCDLTEEQRQLYGGLQDEVKLIREALRFGQKVDYTGSILPVLTKLKQICDHPALVTHQPEPLLGRSEKFDWIVNRIDEIMELGEQVAVFSHFLGMLGLLEAYLREKSVPYIRIDGSTNNPQDLIDYFTEGKAAVALLSLKAAGYGINLQTANHVIHADRWWNPAVEDQATDRVHRLRQKKTVFVYHILVEGTLEERIARLLEKKRGISDEIVGAAVEGQRKWTREELIELLKPLD